MALFGNKPDTFEFLVGTSVGTFKTIERWPLAYFVVPETKGSY